MLKVLLCIVSDDDRFLQDAVNILSQQHNGIELVGVTANEEILLDKDGELVPFIPLAEVDGGSCDVLLVVGARPIGMSRVTQAARQLNLPEEKLLGDWIVCIPGFTLEKYRKLQRSHLSIFSMNCFGCLILHMLGLPFNSPFVNLFLEEQDFIKFLRAPHVYINEQPYFEKLIDSSREAPKGYPLVSLGNIFLRMQHYSKADEALLKWNERKQRINWYNLFVTMFTEDEKILEQFSALPYGKKVCFVPFKSDLDSAWYINTKIDKAAQAFNENINRFGWGYFFYYDLFDMLLYGKKTPLIEM